MKTKTIAAIVREVENKNRIYNITAKGAFNAVLNREITRVRGVDLFQLEMVFIDGSILTVLDTTCAKNIGLTEFDHSFKSQDEL